MAYNVFHRNIISCHDESFPLVRLSRKCARDKVWITRGIKNVLIQKNNLYEKWLCSHNPVDEHRYKEYLKHYKKVTAAAQAAYYCDKFDVRINNTKQLWMNLNKISTLSKTKAATNIKKLPSIAGTLLILWTFLTL